MTQETTVADLLEAAITARQVAQTSFDYDNANGEIAEVVAVNWPIILSTLRPETTASEDVVEALRDAIVRASGDSCETDEAAFYLQTMQRCGLAVSLSNLPKPTEKDELVEVLERVIACRKPRSGRTSQGTTYHYKDWDVTELDALLPDLIAALKAVRP